MVSPDHPADTGPGRAGTGRGLSAVRVAEEGDQGDSEPQGQPHPQNLAHERTQSAATEGGQADRRNVDGSEGEEVAAAVERPEQGHPQPAVGQCIEQGVRDQRREEAQPQSPPRHGQRHARRHGDGESEQRRQQQRM
jgi:hypothetical protein